MDASSGSGSRRPTDGLCAACRHARPIANDRGSRFVLCARSTTDPRYRRYPALPVLSCPGFEPVPSIADGPDPTSP